MLNFHFKPGYFINKYQHVYLVDQKDIVLTQKISKNKGSTVDNDIPMQI